MKTSNILLCLLVIAYIGFILYQVGSYNQFIEDRKKLEKEKSTANLYPLLKQSNTYQSKSFQPFDKVSVHGNLNIQVLKGERYEVFYNDYIFSNELNIVQQGDEAIITLSEMKYEYGEMRIKHPQDIFVYVYMPLEPRQIIFSDNYSPLSKIFGFKGTDTQLVFNRSEVRNLITDLQTIRMEQYSSNVTISPVSQDPAIMNAHPSSQMLVVGKPVPADWKYNLGKLPHTFLSVKADSSMFCLEDRLPGKLEADIQLKESRFNIYTNQEVHIGTLKMQGSLSKVQSNGNMNRNSLYMKNLQIYLPGICDSLQLHLTCAPTDFHLTELTAQEPNYLHERIELSDQIVLVRK